MNSQFKKQPEFKQQQGVQSFYEPALRILNEIYDQKVMTLKRRGHPEKNAAVMKEEFSQAMAYRFRIIQWLAQEIVSSLIKSALVESFGGYVKPKESEVQP
jgi:hypothetical protein